MDFTLIFPGKDIVGIAETGSGKTGAFLLPIIQHWIKCGQPVGFALILAPTRELAQQLANEAERLGQCKTDELEFHLEVILLVGGEDMVDQALKLAWRKHHFIVATPGRLVDHLKQSVNFATQQLSNIRHLVLDEADRMLNMAFADDIDKILNLYEKPKSKGKKRKRKTKPLLVQLADNNNNNNTNDMTNNVEERQEMQSHGSQSPKLVHTPFVPSGSWSPCSPLVCNQGFPTSLSELSVFTNPIKAPDIRFHIQSNNKQIQSISTKYPHPQIYLYSATMTKDVIKLRRAALSSNAVFINENDNTLNNNNNLMMDNQSTTEYNLIQHSNSSLKLNKNLKTGFPIGLSHYCLPIRLADRPTILNWIVENVIQTNLLEKFGITSSTPSRKHHIMIFCKRCHETIMVSEFLRESGHSSVALTGRMKQIERKESLNKFISSEVEVLVATDVASRGLDIPHVEFVINYNVPLSEKTYRHRVGRTARAGQTGVALTLVTRDVAQSFLELEAALLPYLPLSSTNNNNSPGIPRWPIPLPDLHGRNGLLTRRRLADQAWSRASKTIRSQLESHRNVDNNLIDLDPIMNEELIEAYANSDEDEHSNISSSSLSNDELNINEISTISNKHYPIIPLDTSGQAGINAARKTWKSLAKIHQLQQKAKAESAEQQRLTKSIGWGVTLTRNTLNNNNNGSDDNDIMDRFNNENINDDDDGDEQEITHFDQPIKTKYAKIQSMKKAVILLVCPNRNRLVLFVPSGSWSLCAPLICNQDFPTPLGGSLISKMSNKAPDIRFSSSQFRKHHLGSE
ncbi:unnamed protein product [Schistosoma curassoni]|uniref:RNA helicase n=1 Tax=Schistosoma curassoni TaxID=6186 RepID=A0A183JZ78_9TREM|nr:unnamed protein product [Schistosoma curassoni]